jgi:hypothetical protein
VSLFRVALYVTYKLRRSKYFEFEVFIAVTMKSAVFWDVIPCCLLPAQCLLGLCFGLEDGGSTFLRNIVNSYKTTWCYIPEDSTLKVKNMSEKIHLRLHKTTAMFVSEMVVRLAMRLDKGRGGLNLDNIEQEDKSGIEGMSKICRSRY